MSGSARTDTEIAAAIAPRQLAGLPLLGLLIVLLLALSPWWSALDDRHNDLWIRWNAARQQPDPAILVIDIDDRSLAELADELGAWPWARSVHGFLLEGLLPNRPRAVLFDLLFAEPDLYRPDGDAYFAEVVAQSERVYLAAALHSDSSPVEPIAASALPEGMLLSRPQQASAVPMLRILLPRILADGHWRGGLINYAGDRDGVARRYGSAIERDGWVLPSLALRVAADLQPGLQAPGEFRLNYKGDQLIPYHTLAYVDAFRALTGPPGTELAEMLAGRIVLIGSSATGLHDLRTSPLAASTPSLTILATALDNLLHADYYREMAPWWRLPLALLLLLPIWLAMLPARGYRQRLLWLAGALALGIGMLLLLQWWSLGLLLLLPGVGPMAAAVLYALMLAVWLGTREYRARRHATGVFARFLDPLVVRTLVDEQNWQRLLQPGTAEITVLFSDIRGFTTLSERHQPAEVVALLNSYFDLQVETLFRWGATLDKFIGDAVMAFWGAPVADPKQAQRAIAAALEMRANLVQFRQALPDEFAELEIGIGIHSGPAVVGMLGSRRRWDYTAIGDTVNLASRIEGLTKQLAPILVSEATRRMAGDAWDFRELGEQPIRGRQGKIGLYEPLRRGA